MFRTIYLSLLFTTLLTLSACGGGSGGGSTSTGCSTLNARIFGGESCNQSSRSPVIALVGVASDGTNFLEAGACSGALVTLDDFITSAHCFTEPIISAREKGIEIVAFAIVVGGVDGEVFPVVNAALHPLYDGNAGSRYDLAMATIGAVPSPPIGPLPILTSELTEKGSQITAFGYGTNNQGELGELKAADFIVDSLIPGNLLVIGDGNSSICRGDSGGPAVYINSAGVATLAGINSFGVGDCTDTAAKAFGFVDLQFGDVLTFITDYAPDVAASPDISQS